MKRIIKFLFPIFFLISCVSTTPYFAKYKKHDGAENYRLYGLEYVDLIKEAGKALKKLEMDLGKNNKSLKMEMEQWKVTIKGEDFEIKIAFISNHITAMKINTENEKYYEIFEIIEKNNNPYFLPTRWVKWDTL